MKERKKCAINSCNRPATNKMYTTIVDKNNEAKSGYIYLCKKHFLKDAKDRLNLNGEKARVDLIYLKDGEMYLFAENDIRKKSVLVALTRDDIKWIIYFILKNEANFEAKV